MNKLTAWIMRKLKVIPTSDLYAMKQVYEDIIMSPSETKELRKYIRTWDIENRYDKKGNVNERYF